MSDEVKSLDERIAKIRNKSAPLREELDKLVADDTERKLRDRIRKVEAPLYDLEMERAQILKGMGREDVKRDLGTSGQD
jgi:predicted  nucleic acid-binding Zn-ribbon protein